MIHKKGVDNYRKRREMRFNVKLNIIKKLKICRILFINNKKNG